jgi:putative tryptophan/tyrosine transport system substrate-binding protein
MVQKRADALLIGTNVFFINRRVQLVTLAARDALPAIYYVREFVEAGGLMSYGTNNADLARLGGIYVGRVLKGEKPADLPVMQPTRFESSSTYKPRSCSASRCPQCYSQLNCPGFAGGSNS